MQLKGIGVSEGIAVGRPYYYENVTEEPNQRLIRPDDCEEALACYQTAKQLAREQITAMRKQLAGMPEEKIFQAHEDVLNDESMDEMVGEKIRKAHLNVERAVYESFSEAAAMLEKAKDERIRERAGDLLDIRGRLLCALRGKAPADLLVLPEPVIILAKELLPSDTATMDRKNVLAIVTEEGGPTSHTAILAKSFGIPAVVGAGSLPHTVTLIAVDGAAGIVQIEPTPAEQQALLEKKAALKQEKTEENAYLPLPCQTKDGVRIEVGLNIDSPKSAEIPEAQYADFVGLFRTEFLYMQSPSLPTEDAQEKAYAKVLERWGDRFVTLRTLDIGGDKTLPCMELPQEQNPFLGCRALRLCFREEALFRTQLRAAIRASSKGPLWLMFPMVGSLEDFRKAKTMAEEERRKLVEANIACNEDIRYGLMIEIPSIALLAADVAKEADFASIGTNDLCQYLLAADRGNPQTAPYYQNFHPAMFRLIAMVSQAFAAENKPLSICGELGGNPRAAMILVGLGLRKLSMSASCIASVKKTLASYTLTELQELSARVLKLSTQQEVLNLLEQSVSKM